MNARSRQALWIVIGVLIGIVVTQTVIATQRTNDTVTAIRANQRANQELLETVRSCTTPGRPCYVRGQRQTARAIASINRITILAAACAQRDPRTVSGIESCVLRQLGNGG